MEGKLLDVESGKNLSVNDVIWEIQQRGDLLILASDRFPLPKVIKKISAAFQCKVYYPEEPFTKQEKWELTKRYRSINNHERDALAAAIKAYNFFSHKLRQIRKQEGQAFEKNIKKRLRVRKGKKI